MIEGKVLSTFMPESTNPKFGINSWLEDELYEQYLHDQGNVDESWKAVFEKSNGGTPPTAAVRAPSSASVPANGSPSRSARRHHSAREHRGRNPPHHAWPASNWFLCAAPAARIAENMTASLSIPTATSQRVMAVKVIDENRRILNEYRSLVGKSKISYTHIIAWGIVKAVETNPTLNHAYAAMDGEGLRAVRSQIISESPWTWPGRTGRALSRCPTSRTPER